MMGFGLFEIIPLVMLVLTSFVGLVPVAVYIVARWRDDKAGGAENNLGFTTIFGFVTLLGFEMSIAALHALLVLLFEPFGRADALIGLLVAGLLVLVPSWLALRPRLPSRAAWYYAGLALLGSALVCVVALAVLMVSLFTAGGRGASFTIPTLLVHLPVVIAGGFLLARRRPARRDASAST